jgi:hypothetical protein
MSGEDEGEYEPPKLFVHGSVEDLTEGFGGSATDAESGSQA